MHAQPVGSRNFVGPARGSKPRKWGSGADEMAPERPTPGRRARARLSRVARSVCAGQRAPGFIPAPPCHDWHQMSPEQELAPLQDLIDKLVQRESLPKEAPAEAAAASS